MHIPTGGETSDASRRQKRALKNQSTYPGPPGHRPAADRWENSGENLHRHRRRRMAAAAAVFNQNRHRHRRILERGKPGEPSPIDPPRLAVFMEIKLRRPGFARNLEPRHIRLVTAALGRLDRSQQGVPDSGDVLRFGTQMRRHRGLGLLQNLVLGCFNAFHDERLPARAAVGEGRRDVRHLQRRDQQVTLPD